VLFRSTIIQSHPGPGRQNLVYKISITDSSTKKQAKTITKSRFYADSGNIALHSIRLIVDRTLDSSKNHSVFRQLLPGDIDTALFRKIFTSKMNREGLDFAIRWHTGKGIPQGSGYGSCIYLSGKLFEGSVDATVGRFTFYLVKKIIPQILFAVVLLLITGGALIFTWRSLKKQVLLNELRSDFISNISHELKTPVATVKVALESLRNFDMKKDPAVAGEYLSMASLEMERLDQLISKVLNISVLEENSAMVSLHMSDLKTLAGRVIRSMALRFEQEQAEVRIEAPDEHYNCPLDELFVEGVLVNLIDNSLKYAGEKPRIVILLTQDAGHVSLTLTDHGPGIPEQYLNKVFDKFFRVPTGDRHNVKGHGLGLSYAAQVMKQHRGTIGVRNPETGGSAFTLTFPKV
jgi:signal transduction histidine kinase